MINDHRDEPERTECSVPVSAPPAKVVTLTLIVIIMGEGGKLAGGTVMG